ncbi:hypothetical protein AB1Y20_009641 [Prymnesium parvum]|uniref:peptidylprolyl isomerase n=1 Tax=Prymnesium parvum TaxID=97485 RepID=A0AB34K0Y8_PRYPA|mmetsp:Transcript_28886/g.66312  ORF Transcript_28886/g.66312 Transcript_28886/m.66312 type:complete len:253 (+) Transcript_28886:88-846(+)
MGDDIIAETERKLAALNARLPELEGKAHKKERTALNKEIYALENDEAYIRAKKGALQQERAEAAAQDDEAHARRLREEEEARVKAEEEAEARAKAKAEAEAAAVAEDDGECHIEVTQLKKGDEKTRPARGDYVQCTYTGVFAAGTTHGGKDYSGAQFDSTWDSKLKKHKPLHFQHFGGKAIRGWDEALKNMSLGEKVDVTIGPKWAYRKTGIQDDEGVYIVPPNATLCFQMQLVGVRDTKLQDESLQWGKVG